MTVVVYVTNTIIITSITNSSTVATHTIIHLMLSTMSFECKQKRLFEQGLRLVFISV